jgi:outer membrane biosynthesis protein TonB
MRRLIVASAVLHGVLLGAASLVRAKSTPWRSDGGLVEFDLAPLVTDAPARRAVDSATTPVPRVTAITAAALAPRFPLPSPAPRATHEGDRNARIAPMEPRTHSEPTSPGPSDPTRVAAESVASAALAETAAPAPRVDVSALLTGARAVAIANEAANAPPDHDSLEARTARARAATQPYFNELLASSNPMEPTNVHAYYGALARRMRETWRPGFYRTPNMVDALLAAPRRMANVAARYRNRASTFALTGRPDDPGRPLIVTDFQDRNSFSSVTTSTIVEVEQGADGRIVSIRVVRPARVHDFDEAALAAVRAAIPQQDPVPMPGGRRSRFAFDVVASRDAIVPIAGFTFIESNGFFEMHYPGALHVRTRVRPMGSRPLDTPWPLPGHAAAVAPP